MTYMLSFDEIHQALVRCMDVEPPVDYALSSDASQMSGILGEMIYHKQASRSLDSLTDKQRAALNRW